MNTERLKLIIFDRDVKYRSVNPVYQQANPAPPIFGCIRVIFWGGGKPHPYNRTQVFGKHKGLPLVFIRGYYLGEHTGSPLHIHPIFYYSPANFYICRYLQRKTNPLPFNLSRKCELIKHNLIIR